LALYRHKNTTPPRLHGRQPPKKGQNAITAAAASAANRFELQHSVPIVVVTIATTATT
jgi:hypothetical protein